MSLFSKICEGIITEVNASQAYERFYSMIPREEYDEIIGGETNIDKFVQFFLNAVRDDKYPPKRAAVVLDYFRKADPLIRQNIRNSFNAGEYDTPDEIAIDIEYLEKGGVVNKNKFAKEGLIVLAKDENWTITCTTNYLANTHYFGNTSWCTASDRAGRYDGYEMFRRYTEHGNELLIQAASNTDKNEMYQMEIARPSRKLSDYDDPDGCFFSQVCDKADNSITGAKVVKRVGKILEDVLNDSEKMMFCLKKEQEQLEPEQKYQEKQDKIIKIKKEKREKAINEKRRKLTAEADEKNREINTDMEPYWNEVVSQKLYENTEFLTKVFQVTRKLGGDITSAEEIELAKSVNFLMRRNSNSICKVPGEENLRIIKIILTLLDAPVWKVVDFWGDYGLRDCKLDFALPYSVQDMMGLVVVYDTSEDKVVKVLMHTEPGQYCSNMMAGSIDPGMGADDMTAKYIVIMDVDGGDYIMNTQNSKLYRYCDHGDNSRANRPITVMNVFGHPFFVSRVDSNGIAYCCVLLKSPDDFEVMLKPDRFLINNGGSLFLDKQEGWLLTSYKFGSVNSTKLPQDILPNIKDCWKSDLEGYLYMTFKDRKENVFCLDGPLANQFVFGPMCHECDIYTSSRSVTGRLKKGNSNCLIRYSVDDNKYVLKNMRTARLRMDM